MNAVVDVIQSDPEAPVGVFGELLRAWQVPFRILRPDLGDALPLRSRAMIVLGGIMGVHDEGQHPFLRSVKHAMRQALAQGTPLFGICLGGQLLADVAGGVVTGHRCGEIGLVEVSLTAAGAADPLFSGVAERFQVFQWHNDSFTVPPGALHLAESAVCPAQAFRIGNAWGVQFHPEVDQSMIATWGEGVALQKQLLAEFSADESAHRHLAGQLLGNFLALAELTP